MRLRIPRMPPLQDDELTDEQKNLLKLFQDRGSDFAIGRTFLRHPRLLSAYNVFAGHTLSADNTLTKRQVEIVTMRTVWRARAGYQWSRHVRMGLRAGLTKNEIISLKKELDPREWSIGDAALIASVDALVSDFFIPDDIWNNLAANLTEQQCIDAILLCGRYMMGAMFINTAGTQVDADIDLDDDFSIEIRRP